MIKVRPFLLFACCCLLAATSEGRGADWANAGPLFDKFPLTLTPGHRTEALGPLFYSEDKDSQRTIAVPPLFSYVHDPTIQMKEFDFLYPLVTLDRYGTEYRWQVLQVWSIAGGRNPDEPDARRFTLFPLYFQQRSADTNLNYTALLPFYGHLKNRLLRDEIFFVMLPIYVQTRKKDVVTDNYVYPLFHLRHGNGLHGWQFWPLVGQEHKDVTTKTNGFGDVEKIGGHDKRFVLWPFFLDQKAGIGTENPQHEQALIPFYSYLRSPLRDSTTVIWPLFTHVTDREKKYQEWEMPWPLIVFARGEGKTTTRIWPIYSHAQTTNLTSDFYIWLVYKYNRVHTDLLDRHRTRLLLFLYSDVVQKNLETGAAERRVDLWPLFTHKRGYDGSTRLQVLSILEPILPNNKSIDRDYSPLWSIWRAEKNARTHAASQSLLWNLYRNETAPQSRKCSLLFGLFQYQSGAEGKQVRLLYIPVVKTKAPAK